MLITRPSKATEHKPSYSFGRIPNGHITPEYLPLANLVLRNIELFDLFASRYPKFTMPREDYRDAIATQEKATAQEVNNCLSLFGGFDALVKDGIHARFFRLSAWQGPSPEEPDQHIWHAENMPPGSYLIIANTVLSEIADSLMMLPRDHY